MRKRSKPVKKNKEEKILVQLYLEAPKIKFIEELKKLTMASTRAAVIRNCLFLFGDIVKIVLDGYEIQAVNPNTGEIKKIPIGIKKIVKIEIDKKET